jgi:hypothetical protein
MNTCLTSETRSNTVNGFHNDDDTDDIMCPAAAGVFSDQVMAGLDWLLVAPLC